MVKHCSLETLARHGAAHIQRCRDCGGVSLHVGPVSVRVDDAALLNLWVAVTEAVGRLQDEGHEEAIAQASKALS